MELGLIVFWFAAQAVAYGFIAHKVVRSTQGWVHALCSAR